MSNQLLKNTAGFPQILVATRRASTQLPTLLSPCGEPPCPTLLFPSLLCSPCALLPLASTPALPTLVLLGVTLQSVLSPRRPLPSSWHPSSLPGIGLPEADIKNPRPATWGFVHAESHTHLQIPA